MCKPGALCPDSYRDSVLVDPARAGLRIPPEGEALKHPERLIISEKSITQLSLAFLIFRELIFQNP